MIRHLFCLIYILVHPKCRWGAGAFQCWERIKCFRSRCHQYEGGRMCVAVVSVKVNLDLNVGTILASTQFRSFRWLWQKCTVSSRPERPFPPSLSDLRLLLQGFLLCWQYNLIWTLEPLQGVVLGTLQSLSQSRELEPSIALQLRSQWYYHQLHNLNWGWWCLSVCRGVVL